MFVWRLLCISIIFLFRPTVKASEVLFKIPGLQGSLFYIHDKTPAEVLGRKIKLCAVSCLAAVQKSATVKVASILIYFMLNSWRIFCTKVKNRHGLIRKCYGDFSCP